MQTSVEQQRIEFESIYLDSINNFTFHITQDPLIRFLRDRRLKKLVAFLKKKFPEKELKSWRVLIVCGGVGGEGIFFLDQGFTDVTSSDFSDNSLSIARKLAGNRKLKTLLLNAENIDLSDNSYDLVVVQDGLHHLPRPALGFTEMLRIASKATIVVEPYYSLIGNLLGTKWETHGQAVNFVYRWDRKTVRQTVQSYLLKNYSTIKVFRFWDHNVVIKRICKIFPDSWQLNIARLTYLTLDSLNRAGNMMVSVVIK